MSTSHTLRNGEDFKLVISKGRRLRSSHLAISFFENSLGYVRFGISVPERVAKGAVRRNRLKRIVREWFRLKLSEISPGYDFVVTAKSDPGKGESEALRSELLELLEKSGLMLRK